jgi:hypothetical protein
MLFAMDLHARKGMNVCVFLLGKKQNAEIFSSCLDQCVIEFCVGVRCHLPPFDIISVGEHDKLENMT